MKIYLVGGSVRDELLGLAIKDRDWVVVGATPDEMLGQGYRQVGKDFPVFLHPESKEEYALARIERKTGQGHTGFSCNSDATVTLEEDLSRRDLTINAIAKDANGELIDPYGGIADIEKRCLRHVSPAFVEDPLRVLRVARFAARFADRKFEVAGATMDLMRDIANSAELQLLPTERVWSELGRALEENSPAAFFDTLRSCGALEALLPELSGQQRVWQQLDSHASNPPEVLFAWLTSTLEADALQTLLQRIRPPKRFSELAQLCNELGEGFCQARQSSSSQLLEFLQRGDAMRRTERFQLLLNACSLAFPEASGNAAWLKTALATCQEVDIGALAKAGVSGKELGELIHSERITRLDSLTTDTS